MGTIDPARVTKCDKALTHPWQVCHTMDMNKETLSLETLALLDELEADLGCDVDVLDFNPDEDLDEVA